ncbi:unnamed protein product [Protopolystoma xenopodis]|uniref:TRPM-like domain-containing protein n=1 Tax=Protopolystoma xenopodis TaxID=117903 RepID=A0A3S5CUX3_9PLAT|nr:unnamed protein product [Protopolystoma xenopodis]
MHRALTEDKVDFVSLFLEKGLVMNQFLSLQRLHLIYNQTQASVEFQHLLEHFNLLTPSRSGLKSSGGARRVHSADPREATLFDVESFCNVYEAGGLPEQRAPALEEAAPSVRAAFGPCPPGNSSSVHPRVREGLQLETRNPVRRVGEGGCPAETDYLSASAGTGSDGNHRNERESRSLPAGLEPRICGCLEVNVGSDNVQPELRRDFDNIRFDCPSQVGNTDCRLRLLVVGYWSLILKDLIGFLRCLSVFLLRRVSACACMYVTASGIISKKNSTVAT